MIESLVNSLALTLIIEIVVAAILGVRKKSDFLLILLVNIITNPLLVQTLNIMNYFINERPQWYVILFLEAIVVVAEGLLYRNRLNYKKINPFIFSLILNTLSYFGGDIVYDIFKRIF